MSKLFNLRKKSMTNTTVNYAELLMAYQKESDKDTQIAALIHSLQQLEASQDAKIAYAKEEVLNEMSLKDLATKSDLTIQTKTLEALIAKEKTSSILWILTGIWIPVIIAIIAKHFGG